METTFGITYMDDEKTVISLDNGKTALGFLSDDDIKEARSSCEIWAERKMDDRETDEFEIICLNHNTALARENECKKEVLTQKMMMKDMNIEETK